VGEKFKQRVKLHKVLLLFGVQTFRFGRDQITDCQI